MGRPRKIQPQDEVLTQSNPEPMPEVSKVVEVVESFTKEPNTEKVVAVAEDVLLALQAQMKAQSETIAIMQRQLAINPAEKKTADDYKKLVKLMFVEDRPVIAFGTPRQSGDQLVIKLTTLSKEGVEMPVDMEYMKALSANTRYLCEVLDLKMETIKTHQGAIPMKIVTQASDQLKRKTASGNPHNPREIVLEHTYHKGTAKVKLLEGPFIGNEYVVDVSCLNP